ncbi:MAG: ATP-binding cassette domain-containing protein [Deltaproteobacteria bacterium]|nr:ATP-binding cassette domain-containing protein [Deltaproteobacteria bacterium]
MAHPKQKTPRKAPKPGPMIFLAGVTKRFGKKTVLDGIDLRVDPNTIHAVIGGSGHGKSTILKLILGFLTPDEGDVLVAGNSILGLDDMARLEVLKTIGVSFQHSALFDSMSVYENVAFPLREHTLLSEEDIAQRVAETLTRLGLPGIEDKMPAELSGGMKKRVGVARAVMLQPKIMLFDEPETGLDPITTTSIGNLIQEMRDDFGITCLVISHNLENTMRISDRVSMLYKGHIIAEGTPAQLRDHDHPVVRQFLTGSSEGPF